eukprot:Awhi_evm1s2008
MKTAFSILALAAVAAAANKDHEANVKFYEGSACDGKVIVDSHLKVGQCKKMKLKLVVDTPQLKETYTHIKLSGDDFSEAYVFENEKECKDYGDDFDKDKEVTFIRAPAKDACYPCNKCGSAKSVRFDTVAPKKVESGTKGSDANSVEDDAKSGDNAASSVVASSVVVLAATVAS